MTLDIEAIKRGLPEEPWTYRASTPADGFECFYVEAADGSVVIEVPGPQNERQENLARRIASIPAMSAEVERLRDLNAELVEAIEQALDDMGENGKIVCQQAKDMLQAAYAKAAGETAAERTEG